MFKTLATININAAQRQYINVIAHKKPSRVLICVKGSRSPYGAIYVPSNYVKAWRKAYAKTVINEYVLSDNYRAKYSDVYMNLFDCFFNSQKPEGKNGKFRRFNIKKMRHWRLQSSLIGVPKFI